MSKLYVDEIHPKTSGGEIKTPTRPFIRAIHNVDKNTYAASTVVGSSGELTVKESRGITHSNGVFTLPVDGLYMISCSFISTSAGEGVYWRKNGTKQLRIAYLSDADASWSHGGGTVLSECNANDTIDFLTEGSLRIFGATDHQAVGGISIMYIG